MTSNFALSLSFEGIRLMQRVPGGWHLVGEVALDSADLVADLADLRAKGLQLDPKGLRTKLLIPDSQIKYLTIDSAQTSIEDVHQALNGATPYAIDDLVIDFDRTGGRTYIAAVARETLDEAEAFAADHDFAPICFAAIPEPLTFRSEVFFGATKGAVGIIGDAPVERDSEAVKVIGDAVFDSLVEDEDDSGLPVFLKSGSGAGAAAPVPEPEPEATPEANSPDSATEDRSTTADTHELAEDAEVVFASRNRTEPEIASHDNASQEPDAKSEIEEPEPEPLFSRRREPPALAVPTGFAEGPAVEVPPAEAPTPPKPVVIDTPEPAVAPPVTGEPEPEVASGFSSRRTPEIIPSAPAVAPFVPTTAEPEVEEVAAHTPIVAPAREPTSPKEEADNLTVFGARKKSGVRGKPKYFGLKLTAGLLIFLFIVALWANTLDDEGIAGWFSRDDPAVVVAGEPEEVTVAAAPVIETQPLVEETPAPSALAPETVVPEPDEPTQPLPIVRAPTGRVLSPAEADRIYAATGVYQRAPRLPLIPRAASLDDFQAFRPLPVSEKPDQLNMPDLDQMLPDAVIAAQLNPPAPGRVFPRDLRGFILATPDGTVTPDGVIVIAGAPELRPPARPGSEVAAPVVETPVVAAPALNTQQGLILVAGRPPLVPPLRPDGLAPSQVEPQDDAANDAETPDADVTETADATEEATPPTSDDVLEVIAASPALAPPARPDSLEESEGQEEIAAQNAVVINPTDIVTAGGVSLASFRPSLRPAAILENAPEEVVIASDPALAGFRPSLRPDGLAPAEEEVPDEPDLNAVIAAIADAAPESTFQNVTSRAIAASPRPDTRPRNFSQVVARAQAAVARQQTQQATTASAPAQATAPTRQASAATVQPTGPVPGGVAQAATLDNAIRLRDMNLIGVYGRPNARRALVRLGNGRYVKVEVGSSLDGGRVTAIERRSNLNLNIPSIP